MFGKMKFAQRIFLLPFLAISAFVMIAAITFIFAGTNREVLHEIEIGYSPALGISRDLVETLADIRQSLEDAVATEEEEALSETDALKDLLLGRLEEAKINVVVGRDEVEEIEGKFRRYYQLARDASLHMLNEEFDERLQSDLEEMGSIYVALKGSRWIYGAPQ